MARPARQIDITSTALIEFAGGLQADLQLLGDMPPMVRRCADRWRRGVARYHTDAQHPWAGGAVEHWRGNELVRPLNLPALPNPDAHWLDVIAGAAPSVLPATLGLQVAIVTGDLPRGPEWTGGRSVEGIVQTAMQ
ncbi:MAG: hypothetical protein U0Z44_15275 [Kouleothrix sp.]